MFWFVVGCVIFLTVVGLVNIRLNGQPKDDEPFKVLPEDHPDE